MTVAQDKEIPFIGPDGSERTAKEFKYNEDTQTFYVENISVKSISNTGKMIFAGLETIVAGWTTKALDITKTVHNIDADVGWDIFTLANWTAGQIAIMTLKTATWVATITPATFTGWTSVTLATAGASVMMVYQTTLWWIVIGWHAYTII